MNMCLNCGQALTTTFVLVPAIPLPDGVYKHGCSSCGKAYVTFRKDDEITRENEWDTQI